MRRRIHASLDRMSEQRRVATIMSIAIATFIFIMTLDAYAQGSQAVPVICLAMALFCADRLLHVRRGRRVTLAEASATAGAVKKDEPRS